MGNETNIGTRLDWDGAPSEIQQSGPAFSARTTLIAKAMNGLKPQFLLDIGCGRGHVTAVAARHAKSVVAVDVSPVAVDETRQRLAFHPSADQLVGDVLHDRAPLRPVFDAILLSEVLEHLPDDVMALQRCHQLLKPGGCVVVTVPGDPTLWTGWDDLAGHIRRYTRDELVAKLGESGFSIAQITNWGFPLTGWLSVRGARVRSRRVMEKNPGGEIPGLLAGLLPLANPVFKLAAHVEPLFSRLDKGAGYLAVAKKSDGEHGTNGESRAYR